MTRQHSKHRQNPITRLAFPGLVDGQHVELETLAAGLAGEGDLGFDGRAHIHPVFRTFLAALNLVGRDSATVARFLPVREDPAFALAWSLQRACLTGYFQGGSGPASAPTEKFQAGVVELDDVSRIAEASSCIVAFSRNSAASYG